MVPRPRLRATLVRLFQVQIRLLTLVANFAGSSCRQLLITGVGVEKLALGRKQRKFGGQKMPCDPRRSLITHPEAISFSRIL